MFAHRWCSFGLWGGDKIQVRLDIGPQVVELVIDVRKQKQTGEGGLWF